MKHFLLLFIIVLTSCNLKESGNISKNYLDSIIITTPTVDVKGEIKNIHIGCGYNYNLNKSNIDLIMPKKRELNQIKNILNFTGIPMNFEVYSANIDNAVATIINGKRYILYDPKLLLYSDLKSGSYWSSISILAHEIGHHLSGHTITNKGSNPKDELEADKFSGFILFKLGATLDQAQYAMQILGNEYDTKTHPSKYKRLNAIEKGWYEANLYRYNSAIPPPNSDDIEVSNNNVIYELNDFYSEDEIKENFPSVNNYNYGIFEGIIFDSELFSKDYNTYRLTILITNKLTKSEYETSKDSQIGEKFEVYINFPNNASNADSSWYETLIKPGRKCNFSYMYQGNGNSAPEIIYYKVVKR